MLIQITNRCHMVCPHCMQRSGPKGRHMSEETFEKVLDFVTASAPMVVNVTGGEPTEHPSWLRYTKELLRIPSVWLLVITTNGAWIEDKDQRIAMATLLRQNKARAKVQVFSHPKYYCRHEWTVEHKAQFRSIGCITDFESPIFMQDLGRARKNCAEEVAESTFVPSCINSHLLATQARDISHFMSMCVQAGKFCRPLIDIDGNIHMSESWLCQSVAHVSDGPVAAFEKMSDSRPCKGCRLYKNFEKLHQEEMKVLEKP